TVTDDDGGAGTSQVYAGVTDTPATLELTWDGPIVEYAVKTFNGAYTDPGLLDGQTLSINWGDPNGSPTSVFQLPAIQDASGAPTLSVGQTINSVSDSAVLTITSIDNVTGRVGFSTQHRYVDDGVVPGDGYGDYFVAITSTITGDDSSQASAFGYS